MRTINQDWGNFLNLLMLYKWEKSGFTTVINVCVHLNCRSNQVPRFFTSLAGVVVLSPTRIDSILTFASCCLVPMMMNSVLSSFSLSLSDSIQPLLLHCSPELLIAPHWSWHWRRCTAACHQHTRDEVRWSWTACLRRGKIRWDQDKILVEHHTLPQTSLMFRRE